MHPELACDAFDGWLLHEVIGVTGKVGQDNATQAPAGPHSPTPLLPTWFVHSIGKVLEMNAWISHKCSIRGVPQEPSDRRVREWPLQQNRFVAA